MKTLAIGLVALAGLGLAVPHGHKRGQDQHKNLHEARDVLKTNTHTTVVTRTIVETIPAAIIWVDTNGDVVSTEFPGSTAAANTQATPIVSVPVEPTSPAAAPPPASAPPAPPSSPAAPPPAPSSSAPAAPAQDKNVQTGGLFEGGQSGQGSQAGQQDQANQGGQAPSAPSAPSGGSGYGICYDMITDGPKCKDPNTVDGDMALLAGQGYKIVRTYDVGCDVGVLVSKAGAHGMKAFIGINGVANLQSDLRKLIDFVNAQGAWASVDTVNIGNEVVNNGGSASDVISALGTARGILSNAGYHGNVVTVDTFNQHLANPALCANSDYCAANAHSFFDSSSTSSKAGSWVMSTMNQISHKAGKKTVITESGWPSGGSSNGAAIASPQDQATAISAIKSTFSNEQGNIFLFQAFDATYKHPGPMGIEQKFGIIH